jgi:hypothetical protein
MQENKIKVDYLEIFLDVLGPSSLVALVIGFLVIPILCLLNYLFPSISPNDTFVVGLFSSFLTSIIILTISRIAEAKKNK